MRRMVKKEREGVLRGLVSFWESIPTPWLVKNIFEATIALFTNYEKSLEKGSFK